MKYPAAPAPWGLALGSILVCAMGYVIMDLHSLGALGESDNSPSRSEIERLAGLRIPGSASDLQARIDLVITKRTLFLRFALERNELQPFLDELKTERWSSTDVPRDLLPSDRPKWFEPDHARQFLAWEGRGRAVLVDVTDSVRCTVYLKARA